MRCVRFALEVAGVLAGSGEEIGTYVKKLTEPSPYPRELKNTETNDVTDTVGSNIQIDSRGTEVMHIVPRLNEVRF
ncbi:ndufs1 NADH-ubiquinone oxidoreductase subunit [Trifolium repens]|nr:ndufs1 NADH-ubiquinone oxidoreductase subunit [Trifolium repens]